MGNNVFANGRELACKSGEGKVIAAFPDVCFTPPDKVPPTPPGVPIPYPLTSMASDTNDGTKSVIISKKEVMLRDSSNFKKCMGDDAAQTAKKGMISSKITGKVYFTSWSMDVKIQKKNAVRHLDTMTSNHSSPNANAAVPWPFIDSQAMAPGGDCHEDVKKEKKACEGYKPYGDKDACPSSVAGVDVGDLSQRRVHKPAYEALANEAKTNDCLAARKCQLTPYKADKDGVGGCCPGQTGDHVIDDANCKGLPNYSHGSAPCICAAGPNNTWASHGQSHSIKGHFAKCYKAKHGVSSIPYAAQRKLSATAVKLVFRASGCSTACLEAQLDDYFKNPKKPVADDSTPLAGKASGKTEAGYAKSLFPQLRN